MDGAWVAFALLCGRGGLESQLQVRLLSWRNWAVNSCVRVRGSFGENRGKKRLCFQGERQCQAYNPLLDQGGSKMAPLQPISARTERLVQRAEMIPGGPLPCLNIPAWLKITPEVAVSHDTHNRQDALPPGGKKG